MRRLALVLALFGLVAGGWWLARDGRDEVPLQYATVAVDRGPITAIVTATGTVNPVETVQVGTYVSGPIQTLGGGLQHAGSQGAAARHHRSPTVPAEGGGGRGRGGQRARQSRQGPGRSRAEGPDARTATRAARPGDRLPERVRHGGERIAAGRGPDRARRGRGAHRPRRGWRRRASISTTPASCRRWTGWWCRATCRSGQTVAASFQTPTLFLVATDLTKMQVSASVSEADIGGVARGRRRRSPSTRIPARRSRAACPRCGTRR